MQRQGPWAVCTMGDKGRSVASGGGEVGLTNQVKVSGADVRRRLRRSVNGLAYILVFCEVDERQRDRHPERLVDPGQGWQLFGQVEHS